MASGTSEIRTRAFRLLKNSLTLGFILIFLDLLRPELSSFINFEIGGFPITGEMVLSIISLMVIISFGYFILIDAKYFLDFISIRLGSKERGKAKSITYDIAIIISLVLASQLLTPFLASIPDVGNAVAKATNIALLAVGFVIVYHLADEIYYLIRKNIENLIQETSKQIRKERKEKTSKGEAK
jgi:uncharacterized protein YacL